VIWEQELHRLGGEGVSITFWFQVPMENINQDGVRFGISLSEAKAYTLINDENIRQQEMLTVRRLGQGGNCHDGDRKHAGIKHAGSVRCG
jgi:hypothetical protein